jgi:hypothetical protein
MYAAHLCVGAFAHCNICALAGVRSAPAAARRGRHWPWRRHRAARYLPLPFTAKKHTANAEQMDPSEPTAMRMAGNAPNVANGMVNSKVILFRQAWCCRPLNRN